MSHRLEGVFILVICLFGFAWQTIQSVHDYLTYPIHTQMNSIPFGNESHMGAVAVCVPYKRLNGSAYANQTILQVRRNVFEVHDVVESCVITLPNLTRVSCFEVTRVRTYTDPMCQCFAFFELRDLKVPPHILMYDVIGHLDADLVHFKLKVPAVIDKPGARFWAIKLYKEYERLTIKRGDHSKKWFLPETYKKLIFSFDRWSSNFLAVPYQSQCFHYKQTKYLTRYNAIDHCIVENFKTSTGQNLWPPFVYASAGEYDEHEMDRYAANKEQETRYLMKAIRFCHTKYPHVDCRQRIYGLDIKSYQYTDTPFKGVEAVIEFFPPTRIHIETSAAMSLMDEINSIGGIASIWLGVSVFMPLLSISEILLTSIKSLHQEEEQQEREKIRRVSVLRRSARNPSTDSRNYLLPLPQNQYPSTPSPTSRMLVKVLETVFFTLCVTGCILQVHDVIMIYIENPFTSVYVTRPPDIATMPRLTICSERRINESKLKDRYPDVYADLINRKVNRSDWPFELTIHQLFNTTRESSEIINIKKSKFVTGPNMDMVPMSDHFITRRMMNHKYICLRTLSPNTSKDKVYQSYQRDILNVPKWADIVIGFDNPSDEVDLYMHYESNFHQEPGSLEKHVVRLNHKISLKLRQTIYFTRTRRILYENHFTSRCINYLKTWRFSRATMIQKCSSQMMIDRFNELPVDNFINRRTIPPGVRFTRNQTRVQEFIEQCNRKFHLLDCDETFIETKVEVNHVIMSGDHRYAQDFDNKSMNIIIYPPGTGYLAIVQVLRYSLIELFAFCGGVVGAWLGLSVLQAKNLVHQAVRYLRCP